MLIEQEMVPLLAREHANIARHQLGHLHHLSKEIALIQEQPTLLLDALERNVVLVERAVFPTPKERKIIKVVSEQLKDGPYKSASSLLDKISGFEAEISILAGQVMDPGTRVFDEGIKDLADRMSAGWTLKVNGDSPHDNEADERKRKAYDYAIWGHVNGANQPEINIEFWAAHQVERIVTAGLKNTELAWTSDHKDWLLNISTWRAIADEVENVGSFKAVPNMWNQKRPFGLGWASEKRVAAYQEAYKSTG